MCYVGCLCFFFENFNGKVGPHDAKLRNGVVEGNDNPVVIGASLCDHVADHLCSTWHPSIFVRTSITRSECLIWPIGISNRLHCVTLRLHNAFLIGFLSHFHKKSFSSCQKYARCDVTLSSQATCYTLHYTAYNWGDKWTIRSPPLAISVSHLKGDDCSVINYAIIMIAKFKKPSQHICDIVPNTIKTFIPPKIKVHMQYKLLL